MTDKSDNKEASNSSPSKGKLTLSLGHKAGGSFRGVAVEVKNKRSLTKKPKPVLEEEVSQSLEAVAAADAHFSDSSTLNSVQKNARMQALQDAVLREKELDAQKASLLEAENEAASATEQAIGGQASKPITADEYRQLELAEMQALQEADNQEKARSIAEASVNTSSNVATDTASRAAAQRHPRFTDAKETASFLTQKKLKEAADRNRAPTKRGPQSDRRSTGKLTVSQALSAVETGGGIGRDRYRSLASVKRARQKERRQHMGQEVKKIYRTVEVPETITVLELASRMSERATDVIKALMKMGVMATSNQIVDADTAELIVGEMGHKVQRVKTQTLEEELLSAEEEKSEGSLTKRPPVVTIMGHVDHGKTSLLDALRSTDVVGGESGGITQHIGAYQVTVNSGDKVTFIDTPGHAAFSQMRARGANITDIVILVVAADDSIMPQTIEAINHARAAEVPIIVAINKCDLPAADVNKVKTDLLQHELVVESMGGDVLCIEVSAKSKQGLDKLVDAILLQSEVLELTANAQKRARGVVVEAQVEKGRGVVATLLIQQGELTPGEIVVAGTSWGKLRLILDDKAQKLKIAEPAMPVSVLGLDSAPNAGNDFLVVESEAQARLIVEERIQREKEVAEAAKSKGSLQAMFASAQNKGAKELTIIIKADVQGSVEAITSALEKITEENEEVKVNVLHGTVGAINESDIALSQASNAVVIGFNVRANAQARELAKREGVDVHYYSIIYAVIDDVRQMLEGMLSPELKEEFIGYASIREVFNITKVGKIAGCMVTDGIIKKGAGVRLLRDDVVIHEGTLKTLKRMKDEVKEVREGYECGMAFENYEDLKEGDVIEAFERIEEKRTL